MSILEQWAKDQFSKPRMIRYIDGCNPGRAHGRQSHVSLTVHGQDGYPYLWGSIHVTNKAGKRDHFFMKVSLLASEDDFACAEINILYSKGTYSKVIHFEERENAPKKLNREIRLMRLEVDL